MKKLVALLVVIAAAGMSASAALAATPQGVLTGSARVGMAAVGGMAFGIKKLEVSTPIKDGETVNVGKPNDKSGDCDGDTGAVKVTYTDNTTATIPILCAHWTGVPNMSFDWNDPKIGRFMIVRIIDRGAPICEEHDGARLDGGGGGCECDDDLAQIDGAGFGGDDDDECKSVDIVRYRPALTELGAKTVVNLGVQNGQNVPTLLDAPVKEDGDYQIVP